MKEKIKKLIDLKSIITISLTFAMVFFTWKGIIPNELFVTTTSAVFTFYFTRKNDSEVM